jgi:diguanylate cyclase (GGDEF)-like protein
MTNPPHADSDGVQEPAQSRHQIVRILEQHAEAIVNDAVALFPFAIVESSDRERSRHLAELILQLLMAATRDGELDPRSGRVAELREVGLNHGVTVRELFGLMYLIERSALDELALDESFGATSDPWPSIAQMVRRASFDVLGAISERLSREPGREALLDVLTTLQTRAVLLAVLEKEIHRSERFGHPFALIVFDVDHLAEINTKHGYGFGDRVLERIGIVVRTYFREQDWVTRSGDDSFAVLLPETQRKHAEPLAEGVRATVQERLALRDYRSDAQVQVTVSVAVLLAESVDATIQAEQLLHDAEEALARAKAAGRNRVERVTIDTRTIARSAREGRTKMN